MEREYLERRINAERRLARKARSVAAAQAHRQLETLYTARLLQMLPSADAAGWFERVLSRWERLHR